jgi:hypothetical protein
LDLYVALACAALSSPAAPPTPPPPDPRIPRLIADLASDDFARREAASKSLVEAGDAAVPALEAAAKDPSPEVQARARAALKAIEDRKVQPAKVLEILHGSAAFVEGGSLALRDALKPVEQLGLRVDYDAGVDPAQPCAITKHGQTALELVDQLAETGGVGIRIVPGGLRVTTKESLQAAHKDLEIRLQKPMSVELQDAPVNDLLKTVSETVGAPVIRSPALREGLREDLRITLRVRQMPVTSLMRLAVGSRDPGIEMACRYGLVVLSTSKP